MREWCSNCGNEVDVDSNKTERNDNNFCDRDCYLEWHSSDSTTCDGCGETTKKRNDGQNFCSRECYLHQHRTSKKVSCENCGSKFSTTKARRNRVDNIFCQRSCYLEYHDAKVNTRCNNCSAELVLEENEVTEHNFCSRACYYTWLSESMSGSGNHQYIDGTTSKGFTPYERRQIFERDDYTCVSCGSKSKYLNAHHIKPVYKYPELEHTLDNGITLCIDCHADKHREMGEKSIAKLVRSQNNT